MSYWHSTESEHSLNAYILSLGLRPGDLLVEAGLPCSTFVNLLAWVERDTELHLVHHLAKLTGDRLLGLHQSRFLEFEKFGAWGRGILASSTLGDALQFASREVHSLQTGTGIHCVRSGSNIRLWMAFDGTLGYDPVMHHQAHLVLLKMILDLAEEPVSADVSVGCALVSDCDELESVFGSHLEFHAGMNFIEFDAGALELSLAAPPCGLLVGGGPVVHDASLVGWTALDLIRRVISYERPNIRSISDSLGINLRAFQRQLDALGVTFRELVDEYRQACALAELADGRLSVTEIAFRLGYSDSAHFTRAVRRWTGCCPRELRSRPIPQGHWLDRRFRLSEGTIVQRPAVHPGILH